MADNSLNFSIKIKDEATAALKNIGVSVDGVGKVVKKVTEEANRAQNSIVNWAQASQAADMLGQSVMQLQSYCKDLTDAYQVQLVAETQLQTVMRQRMSATDEEIQSIKDLASAQQALGVIGDEVQLSGAQQISTFINEKSSLEALIPAMNNLLAQQKGLNATNQDAVGIGNMMGKAMQGQVDVLQRVGVTFTDAQKSVLQYGTESERAAMLAQVIRDNVGDMNAELARTDAGKQKQLENTLGDIKEQFGAMVQPAMQALTALSQFVVVASGITKCYAAARSLNLAFASTVSVSRIARSSMLSLNAVLTVCKSAFTGAAIGATTLKVAIRGLMISTGVGAAIAVLAFALEKLLGTADDTSASLRDLSASEQSLKQSTEAYTSAASDAKAGIDMELAALKKLIAGHGDESGKVQELNRKYGESLGYHKSAAEWYDVLIRKSADYCKAIGYEAQAKALASQKAAKELELEAIRKRKQALEDSGANKTTKIGLYNYIDVTGKQSTGIGRKTVNTSEYDDLIKQERVLTGETEQLQEQFDTCMKKVVESGSALEPLARTVDVAAMSYDELGKEIETTESKLKGLDPLDTAEINRLITYNKLLKDRKNALDKKYGFGGGGKGGEDKTVLVNPESYKELSAAIEYYQKQLENTKPTETQTITLLTGKINKYKEQQQVIARQLEAAGRPKELDTLENIDKELTYQKGLRSRCSKENLAGIDAEIERLNSLRTAFEEQSHAVKSLDQIHTYRELAAEVAFYERKIQTATETERVEIKKQINALNELREAWDRQLAEVNRPDDISQLNTIEKLSDAVSYYESVQRTQSAQEIIDTQRTIDALNKKKAAMERLKSIPQMQADTERLDGLGDKDLKLELQLIGMDGIKAKIRDLQTMLSDTKNPLDKEQRAEVMELVDSYKGYERILRKSSVSAEDAWSAMKGIGTGMQSVTSALEGNGNAWERVVGIVDGVIQLYQGFDKIISIIDLLTGSTIAHATAKGVEAASETTAMTASSAAAVASVTESVATTAALSAETAAWSALSAAKTFAAHAYIPFAGTGIAAGFVATQQAVITAAALPKFASGGLAYGPTLGLFGEYAGASNNPEVVAPLDRLKRLIQPAGGTGWGKVDFVIDGRTLRGVLNKVDNFNNRTK